MVNWHWGEKSQVQVGNISLTLKQILADGFLKLILLFFREKKMTISFELSAINVIIFSLKRKQILMSSAIVVIGAQRVD